ncbi:MAG: class I SAM-dependent methyltransferase [Phenylobacterium sp.]|nr:MAG: class I SAM-dependent methyltransferase [Phenylobacterium sp.]
MTFKQALPRVVRKWGRAAYEVGRGGLLDAAEWAAGRRRSPLTPPRRLWRLVTSSSNDFHASGAELRDFLVANGLKPEHHVLDVGCGIGRLAIPLTDYLSPQGAYDGFDIMPVAIRWCRRITARHPNFRFRLVDLKSDRYRPTGANAASQFVFPYPDATFDVVVLSSVFTHMFPADMENYLSEIARVMKPGARCVISYYVMTPERRVVSAAGHGAFTYQHRGDGYWTEFPDLPEASIAYDEPDVLAAFAARGLEIIARFDGEWPEKPIQSQDVFVAQKLSLP